MKRKRYTATCYRKYLAVQELFNVFRIYVVNIQNPMGQILYDEKVEIVAVGQFSLSLYMT